MAASKSCHMGAEAVANQVDVLKGQVSGFLLKKKSIKV